METFAVIVMCFVLFSYFCWINFHISRLRRDFNQLLEAVTELKEVYEDDTRYVPKRIE